MSLDAILLATMGGTGLAIVMAIAIWLWKTGQKQGLDALEIARLRAEVDAAKKAQRRRDEINAMPPAMVRDQLGRWVRKPDADQ